MSLADFGVRYGGTGSDAARAVTVDTSGNIFIAGWFSGSFNFGGTTVTSAGGTDAFIAKLNSSGVLQWVKTYGGSGNETVTSIALDSSGNIFIGGNFSGTANLGGTNMPSAGGQDMFVAKYDSSGNFVWEKAYGDTLDDVINAVKTDSSGNVIVTGYWEGGVDFGSGTIFATSGGPDTMLLKLSSSGAFVWVKHFVQFADDRGTGLAVDSSDNIFICGYFLGSSIDLGGGPISNLGASDGYLGKFNSSGTFQWAIGLGGTSTDQANSVGVDSAGNVYVLGFFTSAATIAGVSLTTGGGWDTFLAKYSSTGTGLWGQSFPSPGNFDLPVSLTVDASGNSLIIGHFTSTINLGGGTLTAPIVGLQTIFAGNYSSAGVYQWAQVYGSSAGDFGSGVGLDTSGNKILVGSFQGTGTFGGASLTSAGSDDIVAFKIGAQLSTLSMSIDSIQNIGTAMQLNFGLHGLTETYYSCQVATNLTTFYQSNFTGQPYWIYNLPFNTTYAFRLQSILGTSIDPNILPSNTNTVYGDTPPDLVKISASSTTVITLSFRNNSGFETGFLVQQDTNSNFSTPKYFSVPGVNQSPPQIITNWIQTYAFAPNTTYYYRISATNANGMTLYGPFNSFVSIAPNKSPNPTAFFESQTTDVADQVVNTWFSGGGSIQNWLLQAAKDTPTTWTTIYAPVDDPVNGMTFTTNSLSSGHVYYFRVAATNGAGFSQWVTNRVDMPIATTDQGNWYVSLSGLTNGSNLSGTNWANAWPDFSSARWAQVAAGDNIWVEQGNYNEFATWRTPGTGTPVLIHAATNAPAGNGVAQFLGGYLYRNNTTIDGALNESYSAHLGAIPALYNITNNIGFRFASTNIWINRGIFAGSSSLSNRVLWCETGPVGVWQSQLGEIDIAGVGFNGTPETGSEIAYCYAHDIMGTPFVMVGGQTNFGDVSIHHVIAERAHCNFFVMGYGSDLYNSYGVSTDLVPPVGHPDGFQPSAGWNRIYNNWFKDCFGGRLIYEEMFLTSTVPNMLVYGNLFQFDSQPPAEAIDFTTEPVSFGIGPQASMTASNVLVANNTVVGLNMSVNCRATQCTNLFLKGWLLANNIFSGSSQITLGTPNDLVNFKAPTYANSDVIFDWNDVESGLISYNTNFTTIAGLASVYPNNVVKSPGFVNKGDFHLTGALAGTNLSSWATMAPNIGTDMEGNTRSTWNMGALESLKAAKPIDPNLVLWFTFTNFQGNLIHDDSFNHAAAFREDLYHFPTNNGGAAFFYAFPSQDPAFFGEGQYAPITYTNLLDGMTNATFFAWNSNAPAWDGNIASVHNSVILAAGAEMDQSVKGDWYWGRYSSDNTQLIIRTNVSTSYLTAVSWPDGSTNGQTAFHAYAWTFDGANQRFIGYFDGLPIQTNSSVGVTALHVGGLGFVALSSWPHNGTAAWNIAGPQTALYDYSQLDDGYPNAGWANGIISNMMIFNRTLSASEVQALSTGASPTPPRTIGNVTSFRVKNANL